MMNNSGHLTIVLLFTVSAVGCQATRQPKSNVLAHDEVFASATEKQLPSSTSLSLLNRVKSGRSTTMRPKMSSASSKIQQASFVDQDEPTSGLIRGKLVSYNKTVPAQEPLFGDQLASQAISSTSLSGNGLTLEQAEQFAIGNNPDLLKAQSAIESLQGKHLQVGLKPNPQVGYLAADIGEEGTAGQQGAFFSQTFIRGGKLSLNRAIVCQEIETAKHQLEIDKQRLLTDVRQRFYDLLVAQERVTTIHKFESLSQQAAQISDKLFEEEEISKIANLRSKLQVKNINVVREQADNTLDAATRRFAATIGWAAPDQTGTSSVEAIGQATANVLASDPGSSFATVLANSPEIEQALSQLEAAKWNLNRQVAEPTLDVQVQTSLTHGNVSSDDLVAIQVGVPLRINDRNQGNISSARAEVTKSQQNIASIERDLSKRFSVAWRDYENARIQSEKFEGEILPAASEFYDLVESAYREGEQDYLDLVSAQQTYFDASLQSLNALRNFWRAASLIDGYLLSED